MKRPLFFLTFISTIILTMVFSNFLLDIAGIEIYERKQRPISWGFLLTVLALAPLTETLLFQKLPFDLFADSFTKQWPLILISAIPFGIIHYFNEFLVRDILFTFSSGVLYAYAYLVAKKRDDLNAYLAVVLIHFSYNLFVVLIRVILG